MAIRMFVSASWMDFVVTEFPVFFPFVAVLGKLPSDSLPFTPADMMWLILRFVVVAFLVVFLDSLHNC